MHPLHRNAGGSAHELGRQEGTNQKQICSGAWPPASSITIAQHSAEQLLPAVGPLLYNAPPKSQNTQLRTPSMLRTAGAAHLQLPRSPCAEHEWLVACSAASELETSAVGGGAGGGAGGAGGGGGGDRKKSLYGGGARAALPLTILKKGSCVKGRSRSAATAFWPRAHARQAATSSTCRVAPMPEAGYALEGLLTHNPLSCHLHPFLSV